MNAADFAADFFTLGADLLREQLAHAARYCALDGTPLIAVEGGLAGLVRRCPACAAQDAECVFCGGPLGRPASALDAIFGPCCADCAKPREESER